MTRSQADFLLMILFGMLMVMTLTVGYAIFHFEWAKQRMREMDQRIQSRQGLFP
jgi:uncharacterized membrane protein YciS (DUF1049 family)